VALHARVVDKIKMEWGPEVYSYGRLEFAIKDATDTRSPLVSPPEFTQTWRQIQQSAMDSDENSDYIYRVETKERFFDNDFLRELAIVIGVPLGLFAAVVAGYLILEFFV